MIERIIFLSGENIITVEDVKKGLGIKVAANDIEPTEYYNVLKKMGKTAEDYKRFLIEDELGRAGGKVWKAAINLSMYNITRQMIRTHIKKDGFFKNESLTV